MQKPPNSSNPIKKKLPFGVTEEFVDIIEAASADQLKAMVISIQNGLAESNAFLKGDLEKIEDEKQRQGAIELQEMKANYSEAAAPTRDAIKSLKNRNKLVMELLKKNGGI